jgi:hypothetical protein
MIKPRQKPGFDGTEYRKNTEPLQAFTIWPRRPAAPWGARH